MVFHYSNPSKLIHILGIKLAWAQQMVFNLLNDVKFFLKNGYTRVSLYSLPPSTGVTVLWEKERRTWRQESTILNHKIKTLTFWRI